MGRRTRALASGLLAVLAVAAAPAVGRAEGAGPPAMARDVTASEAEVVPGELLVRAQPRGKAGVAAAGAAGRYLGRAGSTGFERVAVDAEDPEAAAAELEAAGAVAEAQPNYVYRVSTRDPAWPDQWGLDNTGRTILGSVGVADVDIDAPEAWQLTRGARSVVVAVIDTGTDISHPDLAANVFVNTAERDGLPGVDDDGNGYVDDVSGWDFVSNDASVYDDPQDDGHGTHVSGTIAAVADNGRGVAGVAPQVRILPIKAIGPKGGSTTQVIEAIEYATAMGADVINASWGGQTSGTDKALSHAIETSGVLFVAAAGNGGDDEVGDDSDRLIISPAGLPAPNIVSVAAVDNTGALAAFSNYGAKSVDVGAPGVSIVSTYPDGKYAWMDGTSMAAPHVAGAAALVVSRYPALPVDELADVLLASAGMNRRLALTGITVTGGVVNAADALDLAAMVGDRSAPAWPKGAAISVGSVTDTGFVLSWPAASDDVGVVAYEVRVGEQTGNVAARSFPAEGLTPGAAYDVSVVARDAAGNESPAIATTATTSLEPAGSTPPPYSGSGARTLAWACPDPVTTAFVDVATSPHVDGIACATSWGVFLGGGDGAFVPAQRLTRAQLASVLARAIEQALGESLPAGADHFVDDDGNVHRLSIDKLAGLGIVGGYAGGIYDPAAPVTRAQFATMLAATYRHLTGVLPVGDDAFTDDGASPHGDSIDALAALGIVGGTGDGAYSPAGVLTRAQSATMVARLLDALVEAGAAG